MVQSQQAFIEAVTTSSEKDRETLVKTLEFAVQAHQNQKRKSGKAYIIHPIQVALDLWEKYHDIKLTQAALLHDTVEDCSEVTRETIYKRFGNKVGFIVDGVTKKIGDKDCYDFYDRKHPHFADKIDRLLYAGKVDVRVIILKLADRENNLLSLSNLKQDRQVRISLETQAVFLPLKAILQLNKKDISIAEIQNNYQEFLKHQKEKKGGFEKLKDFLFELFFLHIDSKLYNQIYEGMGEVIWEINNYEQTLKLCQDKKFAKSIDFVKATTNGEDWRYLFKFNRGQLFQGSTKIAVSWKPT